MSKQRTGNSQMTTHAAKRMVRFLNGRPAECTINRHCHTLVFGFPGSNLVAAKSVDRHIIYCHGGTKATIASDLLAYFENEATRSIHYAIDVALRTSVQRTNREAVDQRNRRHTTPLFLVVEVDVGIPPIVLDSGECYSIDERIDGEAMIEGGRRGERTLMAFRTVDGAWPDCPTDGHIKNVVLTAIKIEQNVTGYIDQKCEGACFVNTEGEAVRYGADLIVSPVSVERVSDVDAATLEQKADRLRSMIGNMTSDLNEIMTEVFNSVVLDGTHDDADLRLWYLRLWEAIAGKRVKEKHVGYKQLENWSDVIAGNRSPKELKRYRNDIAHWDTERIDYSYLNDLQQTTLEVLRRKYATTKRGGLH